MSFPTTHWSRLAQAALDHDTAARTALEELCRRYWAPLNQFIRGRGHGEADAADLTQEFLLHLMEHSTLRKADPARGKFRSFLLGALTRFLSDARDRNNAQRRGGGQVHVRLDSDAGHPCATTLPDGEANRFDRSWALTVFQTVLERLRQEYGEAGRADIFTAMKRFLPGADAPPSYEAMAAQLGVTVSALNSEVHRLRVRFRDHVRGEVAGTVSAPHEIEEEMAHLRGVLMDRSTDFQAFSES